jgi:hypothetical protein
LEKEKARDLKLMMAIFGDDARHRGSGESTEEDDIPFLERQRHYPMSKWRR